MVDQPQRIRGRNPNDVQDVGLSDVQGQTDSVVQGPSGDWRLSFRTLRTHYRHLQGGQFTAPGCAVCGQGLAGALAPVEAVPAPTDEVAESRRANAEADTTPPPTDWPYST